PRGAHRLALPFDAEVRDEVVTGRGVFRERLAAAIAVVADAARADEGLRGLARRGERLDERTCREHTAVAKRLLPRGRPAAVADRFAREADECVGALELLADGHGRAVGPPGHTRKARLAGAGLVLRLPRRERAREDADVVLLFGPRPGEHRPQKPAAAGDDDFHPCVGRMARTVSLARTAEY